MTDLLKDTLVERADATEPSTLDLDLIITTGDRRIRGRRLVGALGAGTIAAVVVASGLVVLNETADHSGTADPANQTAQPFTERRPTYAVRDQLHYGQEVFSIGKGELLNDYVQTDAGFVYVTAPRGDGGLDGKAAPDGSDSKRGYVTLLDRTGSHRIGGKRARGDLVADDHGSLAGWVEPRPEDPRKTGIIVIYDVAARRSLFSFPTWQPVPGVAGSPKVGRLLAIDEGMAYFSTDKAVFRVNLKTKQGKLFPWSDSPGPLDQVLAVSNGNFLYETTAADGKTAHLTFGPTLDPAEGHLLQITNFSPGQARVALSPDAKHAVLTRPQPDDPGETTIQLFATDTGKELPLRAKGYTRYLFGQWLDNEGFTLAGIQPNGRPTDLLTCSTRRCQLLIPHVAGNILTDRGSPNQENFTFPVGYRVD